MKVERVDQNFKPATITLETQEEFDAVYDVVNLAAVVDEALQEYSANLRGSNHYEILTTLWRGLK